jgi:hypothetical protein
MQRRMNDQLLEVCENRDKAWEKVAEHAKVIKNMGLADVYGVYMSASKGGVIGVWLRKRR